VLEFRVRFRTLGVVTTIALVMLVAGTAIGATLARNGGAVKAVRTVSADDRVERTDPNDGSFNWANVPGMTVSAPVPTGETGLLVITFSGMSACSGTTAFCQIRVLVDGNVVPPGLVAFDSTDDGPGGSVNSYETNSMQFVAGPKRAGAHTVTVQWAISPSSGASFTLTGRTLTVLRSKA
jgi:hypothetical protein